MENKKKEEKILNSYALISSLIIFSIVIYFFFGFYSNENSAGAGGYDGDLKLIWSNFQLLENDIFSNLSSPLYNDSRPPLSYILHILFNPLASDKETYRLSVLFISLIIPILLFFSIKKKYGKFDNYLICLLAIIVLLSPYFRTSAFWGLGENYGLIFLILSYLSFQKLKEKSNIKLADKYFWTFLVCLFSSLTIYFDQKLIFAPLLIFFLIQFNKFSYKIKLLSLICFFLFALPYLYLIKIWGSIIPTAAADARKVGLSIHFFQPIFCLTVISIYILPFFLFFKKKLNFKKIVTQKVDQNFLIILFIFTIYFLLASYFESFNNLSNDGKGAFFKVSKIFIENNVLRLILTYIVSIISIFIIYFFFRKKKSDFLFIFYFLFLSLFTYPFYQEYLDPLIYILLFTFFKTNLDIKRRNVYFFVLYFLVFSLGAKFYYQIIL